MKALFRPFALHAAYTPIETIVFFSIIGTLAYFHILHAIKHSTFLDPGAVYSPPVVKPAHVRFKVGVRESTWVQSPGGGAAVELQQIIFTMDGVKVKGNELSDQLLSALPPISSFATNFSNHLITDFPSASGEIYSTLCHRPSAVNLLTEEEPPCFTAQHVSPKSFSQTLAFNHGMRENWVNALMGEHTYHHQSAPMVFTDENGIRFEVDSGRPPSDALAIGQMKNAKWVAYAARALVIRFWDLAKVRLFINSFYSTNSLYTESRLS
jgi:hydroxymethylglutaryl-CoA reductase (NADPH)